MEQQLKANGNSPGDGYAELRRLLVGPERDRIEVLQRRFDDPVRRAEDVGDVLPAAIRLRSGRDGALRFALHPLIEQSVHLSFQRNAKFFADALFPVLGTALRKGVSQAFNDLTQSLNQVLEQRLSPRSLQWRWEAFRTGKSFGEIAVNRSRLYRVQQVFLIHKETGLLLQQRVSESMAIRDPALVSAILSPIQDFARESYGARPASDLERLRLGEFDVWVQHGPRAILAAVIRGIPPRQLQTVFENTLERIGSEKGYELDHFDGDTSPFLTCQEPLKACFLGKAPAKSSPSMAFWWVLAALAILAFAFGLYYGAAQQSRWNGYLSKLQGQPGIVVTSTQQQRGSYSVYGLKDPMAADPVGLLEGTGIDASKVHFHWEPYHSLQPRFEGLRRLAGDREALEAETLRFAAEGAGLAGDQLAGADRIARRINGVIESAKAFGQNVRIEVQAHGEAGLSRAEQAKAALVNAGAPADALRAEGMKTGGSGATDRIVGFRVVEQ